MTYEVLASVPVELISLVCELVDDAVDSGIRSLVDDAKSLEDCDSLLLVVDMLCMRLELLEDVSDDVSLADTSTWVERLLDDEDSSTVLEMLPVSNRVIRDPVVDSRSEDEKAVGKAELLADCDSSLEDDSPADSLNSSELG